MSMKGIPEKRKPMSAFNVISSTGKGAAFVAMGGGMTAIRISGCREEEAKS